MGRKPLNLDTALRLAGRAGHDIWRIAGGYEVTAGKPLSPGSLFATSAAVQQALREAGGNTFQAGEALLRQAEEAAGVAGLPERAERPGRSGGSQPAR